MNEKEELKTLTTCLPSEFIRQTNKIRKSVEKWLTDTDIRNIRKRLPHKEFPTANMTTEEKSELERRNKEALEKQMSENMSAILDAVLEDHPDETLEILALTCFVEPEHVDDYPMAMYLKAFNQLANDANVLSFFISLAQLARTVTQNA